MELSGRHRPAESFYARVLILASRISRLFLLVTVAVAASTVLTLVWFHAQHEQILIVSSGSMAPAIEVGDAVTIHPVPKSGLKVGDVVTFHPVGNGKLTTHRIYQLRPLKDGMFLQTKGDANASPDPNFVAASSVTGVLSGTIPYLGRWLAFYQSRNGKLIILGAPLLMILLSQLGSLFQDAVKAHLKREYGRKRQQVQSSS